MNQIIIENFKCFEKQEFELRDLTILAGNNGSGKSTLIQSILLLRQTFENQYMPLQYVKRFYLNDYYFEAGTSSEILFEKAKEDKIVFEYFNKKSKSIKFELIVNKEEPRILEIEKVTYDREDRESRAILRKQFDFISADRFGPKLTYEVNNERKKKVGKYGEFAPFVLNEFKNEIVRDKNVYFDGSTQTNNSLLTEVNNWMSYILDGVTIKSEVLENVNLSLLKITNYPETTLEHKSPMNMPYGASYILPIIVSCISKKIMHETESLIIIENPEAHLHPSAQSKLGQFISRMSNSGIQIILETHSDHIINGIRIAIKNKLISHNDVIFNSFSKSDILGENIVEKIDIDENGKLTKWPKGFFDQYEFDMMELL